LHSKKIKIVLLLLLLPIWFVFFGEAYLRLIKPQPILPRYIMSGDFGIRVNIPSVEYEHKTPDYTVTLKTNNKGLRANNEIPYDNNNKAYRVVLLGDSFGMGYGVNLEDTFSEKYRVQLELILKRPVELINLAVSGFGTAEQLLMFENEGVRYKPDLVISTWHDTDPEENIRSKLFKLENGELVRDAKAYLPGVKQREFLFKYPLFRYLAENSHLYNLLRGRAASWVKRLLLFRNKQSLQSTGSNTSGDSELTSQILSRLNSEIKDSGAKHIIMSIPEKKSRGSYIETMPIELIEKYNALTLTQTLSENSEQLLYWELSHGHFTPYGCNLVAGALLTHTLAE